MSSTQRSPKVTAVGVRSYVTPVIPERKSPRGCHLWLKAARRYHCSLPTTRISPNPATRLPVGFPQSLIVISEAGDGRTTQGSSVTSDWSKNLVSYRQIQGGANGLLRYNSSAPSHLPDANDVHDRPCFHRVFIRSRLPPLERLPGLFSRCTR